MKLNKLLEKIDYTLVSGNEDIEINGLSYDSRNISVDDVFLCIIGSNVDGHEYVDSVIDSGVKVLIVSKDIEVSKDITVIKVDDTNKILSRLSMNLFDNPQEKMTTVAITGTKGKTNTSFMIKRIIE